MKIKNIFTLILLFSLTITNVGATFFQASKLGGNNKINNTIINSDEKLSQITIRLNNIDNTPVKIKEVLSNFASFYDGKIPKSYKYIELKISGIDKNSKTYDDLQKLVYVNIFPNKKGKINPNSYITAYQLYKLTENLFNINIIPKDKVENLKTRKANKNDLEYLKNIFTKKQEENIQFNFNPFKQEKEVSKNLKIKQEIFEDVYKTIKTQHYNRDNISDKNLIEGATQGLAEGTKDKFTTYFPPTQNKNFQESLNGEFEGIGSYVEMEKAGILKIISPLPGSPSEKAGIKGGDIVLEVDGKKIEEDTSLSEAVSWIKGPKGTQVELTILRNHKKIKIKVIRDKIIIKSVEYKKLDYKTFYIKLLTFDSNISSEFKKALKVLKNDKSIKKVIIDLRNNGGGYLDQVSDMLGNFVPKGEPTVVVKYRNGEQNYYSRGYNIVDFSKYKIVLLENGGTASASEIFIQTVKDYFPKAIILGEKSYGKGSVQTIKSYKDGSSFKYTIAHWFSGKNQIGINEIGITPDIKLEFDFEKFKKYKKDNQLEQAKKLK